MDIEPDKHRPTFLRTLNEAYDYFEGLDIEPMLSGHTLLGAYRDKDFIYKSHNFCIDLSCKAENLTNDVIDKILTDGYYHKSSYGEMPHTLLYFWFNERNSVELLPKHLVGKERVLNIMEGSVLVWDRKHYDSYDEIELLGRKYRTPAKVRKWLKTYYGEGWNKPDPDFMWPDAINKRPVKDYWYSLEVRRPY